MTAAPLHPVPPWTAVAREQRRAVVVALRKEAIAFTVALALLFAMSLRAAFASVGSTTPWIRIDYLPGIGLPLVLMALFLPLSVWRGDDPAHRAYHWAMPVPRTRHTLTKVAAGFIWVWAAVAAYLLFIKALIVSVGTITGRWGSYGARPWEWLVPFTASAITYALGSAIAVGVRQPSRWLSGVIPAALLAYLLPQALGLHRVQEFIVTTRQGEYGLAAALGISIQNSSGHASVARWGAATLLWGAGSTLVLMVAARRYLEE